MLHSQTKCLVESVKLSLNEVRTRICDYYLMPLTFLQFTIVSSKTKHSGSFYRCDRGAILTIHVDVNGGGERDGPIVIRCVAG